MKLAVLTRYFNLKKPYGADLRIFNLYSRLNADVSIIVQKPGSLKTKINSIKNLKIVETFCIFPFHFLTRLPSLGRIWNLFREAKDSNFVIAEFHPFHFVGLEAFLVSKLLGKKLILDVHDIAGDPLGEIYEKLMYSLADFIIATSEQQKKYISKYNKNVFVIENGSELFEKPKCNKKKKKTIIGFLGALTKENGVDTLIKAMKYVDAYLYLIGEGPLMEKLRSYVKENKMEEKIIFFGYKPKEEAIKLLACADVLVAPFPEGRVFETNLPLKIADYSLLGKPIVVSGGEALKDFIKKSKAGIFSSPSPKGLANSINKILSLPKKQREKLGGNARRYAEKNLTWERLAEKLNKVLLEVLRK